MEGVGERMEGIHGVPSGQRGMAKGKEELMDERDRRPAASD